MPGLGKLEFHPIVKAEFDDDIDAFHFYKNINPKPSKKPFPDFLEIFGEQEFSKIEKFIDDNLSSKSLTPKNDPMFKKVKKVYNDYREKLQQEWRESGKFQGSKKAKSKPTDEDYLLLYDSILCGFNLVTNDEILLEVSKYFFEEMKQNPYMAEDVIKAYYRRDTSLEPKIIEISKTMDYCSEPFRLSIALDNDC